MFLCSQTTDWRLQLEMQCEGTLHNWGVGLPFTAKQRGQILRSSRRSFTMDLILTCTGYAGYVKGKHPRLKMVGSGRYLPMGYITPTNVSLAKRSAGCGCPRTWSDLYPALISCQRRSGGFKEDQDSIMQGQGDVHLISFFSAQYSHQNRVLNDEKFRSELREARRVGSYACLFIDWRVFILIFPQCNKRS